MTAEPNLPEAVRFARIGGKRIYVTTQAAIARIAATALKPAANTNS